jgi:signal transduction histidine kinase
MHRLARQRDDDEALAEINEAVRRALRESRVAIATLGRPLEESLQQALTNTARELVDPADARLELDLDPDVVVPPAWEQALPRLLREIVANAVEHGHPHTVTVHLRDADGIWLRVTDDGRGFDASRPGFGLIGVRERTEALGGEFKLASEPGLGTAVDILLP